MDVISIIHPDDLLSIRRAAALSSVLPNTGPSLENLVFDPTYYGLTILIMTVAVVSAILTFRFRSGLTDRGERARARGLVVASLGFIVVFIAATAFLALLRTGVLGGFLYLQAQFLVVYVGSAMMLYGVDATVLSVKDAGAQSHHEGRRTKLRAALWLAFALSVATAVAYLFNPSTYTVTASGSTQYVAQEGIFWLPPMVTFLAGIVGLPLFALTRKESAVRRHAAWLGLFFMLELLGALKESNLIPSSGDPYTDLLVAFVPFTAGAFCLLVSTRSLRSTWPSHPDIVAQGSPKMR